MKAAIRQEIAAEIIGNDLPSDVQLNQSTNVYRELRPHNEQYHFQSH